MKEKVVLAYSGGLDTSITIPWLKEIISQIKKEKYIIKKLKKGRDKGRNLK